MARSGTEKRKRTFVLTGRFNEQETLAVKASGLSVAAHVRRSLGQAPPPRAVRRRPAADQKEVARLLGLLGNIASNVNQYAKHRNMGRPADRLDDAMYEALRDFSELRTACLQALGQEPGHVATEEG